MTTPTKEQIRKIAEILFDTYQGCFGMAENIGQFNSCMETTQNFYIQMAETSIQEWEKIRNSPKYGKI